MLSTSTESMTRRETEQRRRRLAEEPRRRCSPEFKLQVVQETFELGTSVAAVARRHGMNANVIFRWRKLFREGRLSREAGQKKLLPPADFIPVQVIPDAPALPARQPPQPEAGRPPRRGRRGMMEITLRCGVVIRVGADVDDEALSRVVAAVGDLA